MAAGPGVEAAQLLLGVEDAGCGRHGGLAVEAGKEPREGGGWARGARAQRRRGKGMEAARGRRWDREDGDRALRRWREDEGEMETDGSEEEGGLGLGGAAGPWEAGPVERKMARDLVAW